MDKVICRGRFSRLSNNVSINLYAWFAFVVIVDVYYDVDVFPVFLFDLYFNSVWITFVSLCALDINDDVFMLLNKKRILQELVTDYQYLFGGNGDCSSVRVADFSYFFIFLIFGDFGHLPLIIPINDSDIHMYVGSLISRINFVS